MNYIKIGKYRVIKHRKHAQLIIVVFYIFLESVKRKDTGKVPLSDLVDIVGNIIGGTFLLV